MTVTGLSRLMSPLTMAQVASGLQALARADVRDLQPGSFTIEPFQCRRCLDLGWVSDWANWPVGWAWQRVQPVPRVPCPDCNGAGGKR